MHVDLQTLSERSELAAELCIVGSGAAGLALAREFLGHAPSVLLLESGGLEREPAADALLACEVAGHAFVGATAGRARVWGGTTTLWGGQALPLDAIDFEARPWVARSGWPIGRSELLPYYRRADAFLGVDPVPYETDLHRLRREPRLALDSELVGVGFSKWAPRPNLRELVDLKRSPNVRLLTHANVTRIVPTDDRRSVSHLEVRPIGGAARQVRARAYVLACGAIENARLLLLAPGLLDSNPAGRMVGRCLLEHPTAVIGELVPSGPADLQRTFNYSFLGRTRLLPRLWLAASVQRAEQLLNASAIVQFVVPADSPFDAAKNVFRDVSRGRFGAGTARSMARALAGAGGLWRSARELVLARRVHTPGASPRLYLLVEQPPALESRIELSGQTDALGLPRARIVWRLDPAVGLTLRRFTQILERELGRIGLGRIEREVWARGAMESWAEHVSDISHQMGTTRMSDSAADGVVDRNARVFGLDNLYLAGGSVFPTGGHSNPTLTLIALALRLADHLKERLHP